MTLQSILIAEDEGDLVEILTAYLDKEGYRVVSTSDGSKVNGIIRDDDISLLLLDVMLPKMMGFDALAELREFSEIPVIMMTSLNAEKDRLRGFDLGADDYVCKPFSPREVVARVKSVLKRAQKNQETSTPIESQPIILDEATYTVFVHGQPASLTASEFKLLSVLVHRPNCIFSRDQLLDEVTGTFSESSYRAIDSHIKNIRKKIGKYTMKETVIHTVYGVGYKLTFPSSPY